MKLSNQKGITLIALVTTVFVLIILTAVAINKITENDTIEKTKDAASKYEIANEIEKLQREVSEWAYNDVNGEPTLKKHLQGIYGEYNVVDGETGWLIVTVPSGNRYRVNEDGVVESYGNGTYVTPVDPDPGTTPDGDTGGDPDPDPDPDPGGDTGGDTVGGSDTGDISITLSKTSITRKLVEGTTPGERLTATLNNATGKLTWSSSEPSVAKVEYSGDGSSVIVRIYSTGEANLEVKYAENDNVKATCTVTVTKGTPSLEVSFTDDYTNVRRFKSNDEPIELTLKARLYDPSTGTDVDFPLEWSSSDKGIASVTATDNEKYATVKIMKKGVVTIKCNCSYFDIYEEIKIRGVEANIGKYVIYDVDYVDMYSDRNYYGGSEQSIYTGWRFLGTDEEGRIMIISSGIPLLVNFNPDEIGGRNSWWYGINGTNTNPWKMMRGLENNLEKIPYSKGSNFETSNTAIGQLESTYKNDDGETIIGEIFRSDEFAQNIYSVRTLTEEEFEAAGGDLFKGDVKGGDTESEKGLFNLSNEQGRTAQEYWDYWGWAYSSYTQYAYYYRGGGSTPSGSIYGADDKKASRGVRPVIVLKSVELVENENGVLEIKTK